jgi:hypothetical protein
MADPRVSLFLTGTRIESGEASTQSWAQARQALNSAVPST